MIKAEVISHKDAPGPNWLERCRTAITPSVISSLIAIVAIGSIVTAVIIKNDRDNATKASNQAASQQSPNALPLSVKPVAGASYQTDTAQTNVQAANGADSAIAAPSGQSQATPAERQLNNTGTTPDAASTPANSQSQLRGSTITNGLQTTLHSIDKTNEQVQGIRQKVNNLLNH